MYRHSIEDCCCCGECRPKKQCEICGRELGYTEVFSFGGYDVLCEYCFGEQKTHFCARCGEKFDYDPMDGDLCENCFYVMGQK